MTARASTSSWTVGVVGLAIAIGYGLRVLIPNQMDPSIFLALGEESPIQTQYARLQLGEVVLRDNLGHDGRFFFAQANDPWYLHPEINAATLDRPIYRGQRMLYPMLASGFGLFPPEVVVWGMLVVNVLAVGVGSLLAARLAGLWGASPWLGLAVPLNIGLMFEIDIGGAGVVAYVLCVAAVYALAKERLWLAAALLAGATLSREVMFLFAGGVLVLGWIHGRRRWWQLVVVPGIVSVLWLLYLEVRLTGVPGVGGGRAIFAAPFIGMWQALSLWSHQPDDLLINVALLAVVVAFVFRAVKSRLPLAWGALPFVLLAPFLSVYVWSEPFDLARALTPVFTAAVFLFFVEERETVAVAPAKVEVRTPEPERA